MVTLEKKKASGKVVLRKSQALLNELPDEALHIFPAANLLKKPSPRRDPGSHQAIKRE